ncbi:MAG TPA: hypothetical protein VF601_03370 [Beijerinckiaceae bacterium]|jgi:hypothetical protein
MKDKPDASGNERPGSPTDGSIERPRLTPQGRTSPDASGQDATDPKGSGAKEGQVDKAEG